MYVEPKANRKKTPGFFACWSTFLLNIELSKKVEINMYLVFPQTDCLTADLEWFLEINTAGMLYWILNFAILDQNLSYVCQSTT